MIELFNTGAYLLNGTEIVKDDADAQKVLASKNINVTKEEAAKNTIAYGILEAHNTSGNMDSLKIKFDCCGYGWEKQVGNHRLCGKQQLENKNA